MQSHRRGIATGFAVAALVLGPLAPRLEAQIPESFTNLEILPADISRQELVGVMRSFAGALKVRCNHCHVGENPESLQGYDFASDDKEAKRIARVMMRMAAEINATWIPQTGRETPLEVQCVTCHHGTTRPQSLRDLVLETLAADGLDAAVSRYRELRESAYGVGSYDFSAGTLNSAAESLAGSGQTAEAIALQRLNLEFHDGESYSHFLLGKILIDHGERDAGIASIEKAAELAPENGWYRQQLEALEARPSSGPDPP